MDQIDIDKIPLDDKKTWDLICSGKTKGCFQIESKLLQHHSKLLKPKNIEELSQLIAIVRPGTLQSGQDKVYYRRRNGEEPNENKYKCLEPILKDTYQIILYQEQILEAAKIVAGFDLVTADLLRRAVSKKLPEEMSKMKEKFLDGAEEQQVVSREEAEEIFSWIEDAQRYSFNHCVEEDTIIQNPFGANLNVSELYEIGGDYGCGISLREDGVLQPNFIDDIKYSGKRAVYKVKTENGRWIKVTNNHKFPTDKGEKRLDNLNVGTNLCVYSGNDIREYVTYTYEKIISIDYCGYNHVYDVTMHRPHHNFVVNNGIVTCNSHSISYALLAYQTAYVKANYPIEFYCSWLTYSKEKQDPKQEIFDLVQDASLRGITVQGPDIKHKNVDFDIVGNKQIKFGLQHIKHVGKSAIKQIVKQDSNTFSHFLQNSKKIKRNVCESLIKSGACDSYGISRKYMLKCLYLLCGNSDSDNQTYSPLTEKEFSSIIDKIASDGLISSLQYILDNQKCVQKRRSIIEDKIEAAKHIDQDTSSQNSIWEKDFLGLAISCSPADDVKKKSLNIKNCKDISTILPRQEITLHVVIDEVRQAKTKSGNKSYAFLSVSDSTLALTNVVCWPNIWKKYKHLLEENKVIEARCKKNMWRGSEQIVVEEIIPLD